MNVERTLQGRRAIVTGAAQGLGRAFAVALAEAGADVAVCDIQTSVKDVAEELQAHGARAVADTADVTKPDEVAAFVSLAVAELGGLDLVVNNAGVVRATSPTTDSLEQAVEDFRWMVDVNLGGTYLVGRAAIPHIIAAGTGDIVNVTTDHIHTCGYPIALDHADAPDCPWAGAPRPPLGGPVFDVYDSSKWGIKGLTLTWSRALAPHGVRVNAFGMGATNTPMYRSHLGANPVPPTTMQPEQVAAVLVDLLAEGPGGRTGDSIELWVGHPCVLPPVGLDGTVMAGATR
jgi:NAD(P)-dependent dehydrogenase (short-subunit alcohol dehydrogenase family)